MNFGNKVDKDGIGQDKAPESASTELGGTELAGKLRKYDKLTAEEWVTVARLLEEKMETAQDKSKLELIISKLREHDNPSVTPEISASDANFIADFLEE
jgi:hypothetical protein